MTGELREAVFATWRAMPVVDSGDVEVVGVMRQDGLPSAHWVVCPCGGKDHYGYHPIVADGLSSSPGEFITCFFHDRQFRVRRDAAGLIHQEEVNYLKAVERWDGLVARQRAKRADFGEEEFVAFMHDTHGVERDFTEVWLSQNKEFKR